MTITINLQNFIDFYFQHVLLFRYLMIGLILANLSLIASKQFKRVKLKQHQYILAFITIVWLWPFLLSVPIGCLIRYGIECVIKLFFKIGEQNK